MLAIASHSSQARREDAVQSRTDTGDRLSHYRADQANGGLPVRSQTITRAAECGYG